MSNSREEILDYYKKQAKVLESYGWDPWAPTIFPVTRGCSMTGTLLGFYTGFTKNGKRYVSFYVLESQRGTGAMSYFIDYYWSSIGRPTFVTLDSCKLVSYFERFEIPYECPNL